MHLPVIRPTLLWKGAMSTMLVVWQKVVSLVCGTFLHTQCSGIRLTLLTVLVVSFMSSLTLLWTCRHTLIRLWSGAVIRIRIMCVGLRLLLLRSLMKVCSWMLTFPAQLTWLMFRNRTLGLLRLE